MTINKETKYEDMLNECAHCVWHPAPWHVEIHELGCYWEGRYEGPMDDEDLERYYGDPNLIAKVVENTATSQDSFDGTSWTDDDGKAFVWGPSCTHALQPYTLTDGTIVYLSAYRDRDLRHEEPDLAVYLDDCWKPATVAFNLPWQDFGLPYLSDAQVLVIARHALSVARDGGKVEIACYGGHGRTGTFLAILDCLTMKVADAQWAIDKVQAAYCKEAIETRGQEWYVAVIAALLNGTEIPEYPKPLPVTKVESQSTGPVVVYDGKTGKKKGKGKVGYRK